MSVSEWVSESVVLFEMSTDGNSNMYHLYHGSIKAWKHESMVACKHGSMEARKQESMETCRHGNTWNHILTDGILPQFLPSRPDWL